MSWSSEFDTPVPGFLTLRDAANHITKLSKSEQSKSHWQFAAEMLLKASEHDAYILFAGMAMMKALNHGEPETPREPRRKAVKKYRVIR